MIECSIMVSRNGYAVREALINALSKESSESLSAIDMEKEKLKMTFGAWLEHLKLPSAMGNSFVDTAVDIMLKCFR